MSIVAALAIAGVVVTGRVPGTTEIVDGPHLASRTTRVTIDAGIAHTEVEDVVSSDDSRELEARYVLSVPDRAVVSRLALDVNGTLVEGNAVESQRAQDVYRTIVDRRRRDPALVERMDDGSISVRIFPIPPHGSRRIVVAYDEPSREAVEAVADVTLGAEALVVRAAIGQHLSAPDTRAIAIDVSRGQSDEAIAAEIALARSVLRGMDEGSEFVLLACDSACESMAPAGLTAKSAAALASADVWLARSRQRGARDVAGAIGDAASRVRAGGQVIWIGAGTGTAGELEPSAVAASVRASLGTPRELRLVAVNDDGKLASLARASSATYDELPLGEHSSERIDLLATRLHSHAIVAPRIELPRGMEIDRDAIGSVSAGAVIAIVGELHESAAPTSITVRATVGGSPFTVTLPVRLFHSDRADLLLAGARVDALERRGDEASLARAGRIAQEHKLLARHSSWLALESAAMMRAFGVDGEKETPSAHVVRAPAIRASAMITTSGRLPPEIVQQTVRNNASRFRFCYEAGLRTHPGLEGRVAVKFVITPEGAVVVAEDAGSDLPDRETIDCFVRNFGELTFSNMADARITVVYPFVLTPLEGTSYGPGAVLPLRVPESPLPDPHAMWLLRYRVEDSPADREANQALVSALDKLGDASEATAAAEAFVHASPGDARAYDLLRTHSSPLRAAEATDALSDLFPSCAAAHARAADAWMALGDHRRAAAQRRSARLASSSTCPDSHTR